MGRRWYLLISRYAWYVCHWHQIDYFSHCNLLGTTKVPPLMILTRMWSRSDTRLTLSFPDFVFKVVEMLFKATTLQMKFAGGGKCLCPVGGWTKGRWGKWEISPCEWTGDTKLVSLLIHSIVKMTRILREVYFLWRWINSNPFSPGISLALALNLNQLKFRREFALDWQGRWRQQLSHILSSFDRPLELSSNTLPLSLVDIIILSRVKRFYLLYVRWRKFQQGNIFSWYIAKTRTKRSVGSTQVTWTLCLDIVVIVFISLRGD